MLKFKNCPYRNRPYMGNNSQWIVDIYQKYFQNKTDGFLVEIGVGYVIDWHLMSYGSPPYNTNLNQIDPQNIIRGESHTIELLENGWTGIYIDTIHEFIDELDLLLKKILPQEQFNKIKLVKSGASDKKRIVKIIGNETISILDDSETSIDIIIPYNYQNRKLLCDRTSNILEKNNCPFDIDLMVIDVEGHEINVIRGLDFLKYRPKLILIEIAIISLEIIQCTLPKEYIFIGADYLNAAFVHSDFYIA